MGRGAAEMILIMSSLGFTGWALTRRPFHHHLCLLSGNPAESAARLARTMLGASLPTPTSDCSLSPSPASRCPMGRDTRGVKGPPGGPPGRARRPGEGAWPPLSIKPGRCFLTRELLPCGPSRGLPAQKGLGRNVFLKPGHLAVSRSLRLVCGIRSHF